MIYVPLHVFSGYSFLKSSIRIEEYLKYAKKINANTLGLCDDCNFYGVPKFIKLAEKNNIKPIIGIDIEIEGIIYSLFVQNEVGYLHLLSLHHLKQIGKITLKDLKELQDGLIVIIGTFNKLIIEHFESDNINVFAKYLFDISNFNNCFIGIDVSANSEETNDKIREFLLSHGYNIIAFPHIKYLRQEDAIVLKMLEAINNDQKISIDRLNGENYLLDDSEAINVYKKEELENTFKVADMIDFNFSQKRGELLHYPLPDNQNADEYLKDIATKSLIAKGIFDEAHQKRLNDELKVISEMKYSNYFLIVSDYVRFAKNNNIAVGPGRGSSAGSLTAYALNIVNVDPLKYGLLFERFLNPHRQSLPDIDLDVSDIKRNDVIAYLENHYGKEKVANIITFQSILAKQSLRDIGRIYDYPSHDIDLIAKLIVDSKLSLRDNYRYNRPFRELIDSDKYYLRIVSLASKIEGLPRQAGMHAAGIILNNSPLYQVIPLDVDENGNQIVQYEMNYLEEQGFLKMDILGLRNLTIIDDCLNNINENRGLKLTSDDLPIDDFDAIKLIKEGNTTGVFQLESKGMKQAIKVLSPANFEDLVALLALYRPGPMKNIPSYARRKEGKEKITYLSPTLENILKSTYGIIVYQEQIMQIAHVMAGFSLADADIFRRAISKKDADTLLNLKTNFLNGALKNHYSTKEANNVFELILKFADYGFNRSHSLCYAMIVSKMAYLKAHYPVEFFTALLNDSLSINSDNFILALSELRRRNIKLVSPNINLSGSKFRSENDTLIFPLNIIKGLNSNLTLKIEAERQENGEYRDFFDFFLRCKKIKLSSNDALKLIDSGAFDCLYASRATLRSSLARAIIYANMMADTEGVIALDDSLFEKPQYVEKVDDDKENIAKEHDALGIILSEYALNIIKKQITNIPKTAIINIPETDMVINLVAIISVVKVIRTKKGLDMAFIACYDETGEIELTIFTALYQKVKDILIKDKIVKISGIYKKARDDFRVLNMTELEYKNG